MSSFKKEDEEANLYLMANTTPEEEDDEDVILNVNKQLQEEVIDLRQRLAKFVKGSENLEKILKHKRHPYDKSGRRHQSWYLDSGCSCHMMGERSMFQDLRPKISKHHFSSIDNVYLLKKLGHASLRLISKMRKHNLIRGLQSIVYKKDLLCDACQKKKHVGGSSKSTNIVSISIPLELLHICLFGLTRTTSMSGKRYGVVVVDDYFRWTCGYFSEEHDILNNFSCLRTPQHNGVIERKNMSLQDMAKTMLNDN
ncbi:hypothetical protein CR513_27016, partial [Mucuna pruriens]